jgi:hypothetical protein
MESEFIAMAECVAEVKHLRYLVEELSGSIPTSLLQTCEEHGAELIEEAVAISIKGDNTAAIKIGNQDCNTKRSRMVNTKFHTIREAVENKLIHFQYVNTKENLADIFTKCLAKAPFMYLRSKFMSST